MSIYSGPFTPFSYSGRVEYDAGECCDGFVNLTPHELHVRFKSGARVTIPSHGVVRVAVLDRYEMRVEVHPYANLTGWAPDCLHGDSAPNVRYTDTIVCERGQTLPPPSEGGYFAPVDPAEPGLWPRKSGPQIWFIVSTITAMALARNGARPDVLAPGPEIRDESGRVVGCAGLIRVV